MIVLYIVKIHCVDFTTVFKQMNFHFCHPRFYWYAESSNGLVNKEILGGQLYGATFSDTNHQQSEA